MPLYEYRCRVCGEQFEFFSRLHELNREIKCPKCGAEKPERIIRITDEVLKGISDCASPGTRVPRSLG